MLWIICRDLEIMELAIIIVICYFFFHFLEQWSLFITCAIVAEQFVCCCLVIEIISRSATSLCSLHCVLLLYVVNTTTKWQAKEVYRSLWWTHRRATECHLPYGITHFYLPLDTGECGLLYAQPSRLVLTTMSIYPGWMESWVDLDGYILKWFACLEAITDTSSS